MIYSYFSRKTYVVTPHQKRLDETILMMRHKYVFYGKVWINIPKLSLLPILIWRTAANCAACQCSSLRRKFMECYIIKPAQSLLVKHLVIGQR